MFDEYFMYGYEHLNAKGRQEFVTDKIRWDYYDRMNSRDNLEIFNDKRKAYELFKDFYKRELIEISDDADLDIFARFYENHDKMVVKPIAGSGGKGIFVLKKSEYASVNEAFAAVRQAGSAVVEQLIVQAPEMAVLNPGTVNTVRAPMLRTRDGVVIFHPFVRCGCGNTVVDNAAAGGIFAEVDPETGIVITKGVNEHGGSYIKHPVSGVIIPGFEIPRWNELIELVNKLSMVITTNNYVGWDLALTESGWVMVEGNPRGQFVFQIATQKGAKQELEHYISKM